MLSKLLSLAPGNMRRPKTRRVAKTTDPNIIERSTIMRLAYHSMSPVHALYRYQAAECWGVSAYK